MPNKRFTETRIYKIWTGMKQRCYNANSKEYRIYGGRGIKVCDEWMEKDKGARNFYHWAKENGYKFFLTLDRIDNNGNYCPENCRWATRKQQANNKRNTILIDFCGVVRPVSFWSKKYKLHRLVITRRLERGISGYKLFVPAGIMDVEGKNLERLEKEITRKTLRMVKKQ